MESVIKSGVQILFTVPVLVSIAAVLLVYWFYRVAYEPFNYWKKRGVPQEEVDYPLIGSLIESIRKSPVEITQKVYNDFPEERFVGTYTMRTPSLMIRDPDLIEAILIKDFAIFSDRASADNPKSSILAKHLLNLKQEHWKNMRSKLSPTFSSGKLKGMHSQLIGCTTSLMKYMKELEDGRPFEAGDVISKYTMDVIASCAFGLNIDTINDPDSEFRKIGLSIFEPSLQSKIFVRLRIFPNWVVAPLRKLLSNPSASARRSGFFQNAVNSTVEYRKKNNIVRPDFLHLMNELKEKDEEMVKNKQLDASNPYLFDEASLLSNAFVFFLAGFKTTSTTVSNAMYELAMNPDLQQRAYEEVTTVLKESGGKPDYDACQKMKFLEMIVCETLRKYPPAITISRRCTEEYRIPGTDTVLPKGTAVVIPIFAVHHDPQYYPDPDKFVPERFDEEKDTIRKGTYLPFGLGPRICIGARFAKLEVKVCLATILQRFEILKCAKTQDQMKFDKNALLLAPEGGIWISVRPRAQAK